MCGSFRWVSFGYVMTEHVTMIGLICLTAASTRQTGVNVGHKLVKGRLDVFFAILQRVRCRLAGLAVYDQQATIFLIVAS